MQTKETIKLQDTSADVGANSRLESYWKAAGYRDFFNDFRNGKPLPVKFKTTDRLAEIIKLYHLKSVGFGNWVTQEDRFNYIMAMFTSFYDIDKVLQFKKNIGLNNRVSFSFGARGRGKALAHFEPWTFIINITRYKDNPEFDKKQRFAYSGGAGSVAHEYGHALDFYFGMYKDQSLVYASLSGDTSIKLSLDEPDIGPLRRAMADVMDAIIWKEKGRKMSPYYIRLKTYFNTPYMLSRCEIFARAFEKYIQYKLKKQGIKNIFLTDPKYSPTAYLTDNEMITIAPLMDRLIKGMRELLS